MLRWFSPFPRDIFSNIYKSYNLSDLISDPCESGSRIEWKDHLFDGDDYEQVEDDGEIEDGENAEEGVEKEIEEKEKDEKEEDKDNEIDEKMETDEEVEVNKKKNTEMEVDEKKNDEMEVDEKKNNVNQIKSKKKQISNIFLRNLNRSYNEAKANNIISPKKKQYSDQNPDNRNDNINMNIKCSIARKSNKRKALSPRMKAKKNKKEQNMISLDDTGRNTSFFINLMPTGMVCF